MKRSKKHNLVLLQTLALCVTTLGLVENATAQHQLDSSRITKSFTEPIEKSVAASAEVGIIAASFVKEGDRVNVGDRLAEINQTVLQESLAIAVARAESTARLDVAASQVELLKSQLEAINSSGRRRPHQPLRSRTKKLRIPNRLLRIPRSPRRGQAGEA